jgi:hypothetical protein
VASTDWVSIGAVPKPYVLAELGHPIFEEATLLSDKSNLQPQLFVTEPLVKKSPGSKH